MGRKENQPEKCVSLYNDNEKRCDFHSIFVLSSSKLSCFVAASVRSSDFLSKRRLEEYLGQYFATPRPPRKNKDFSYFRKRSNDCFLLVKDECVKRSRHLFIITAADPKMILLKSFHFEFSFPIKVKPSNGILINNFFRDILGGTTCLEKNLILSREKKP